jgi:serine/threonine protein kinase
LAHSTSSLEEVVELTDADIVEQLSVRYGGRYELLSLVGRGAYGSVYRARDTELEETVAVKVLLREHIVRPEALERFRREVRLARRVAHPNVARTFDIGSHKDERFLTMEYIDGHPLTRLTPIGAPLSELLPLRLVIDVAVELCAGLGALHAASIVHCDMKSDNILTERD